MIVGVGIDLCEVPRMERALERNGARLLGRLFTPAERDACESAGGGAARWAARFAGKEAVLKALGTGWSAGVGWHDVEILRVGGAAPEVRLSGGARRAAENRGATRCHLSLTHERGQAAALAILEGPDAA